MSKPVLHDAVIVDGCKLGDWRAARLRRVAVQIEMHMAVDGAGGVFRRGVGPSSGRVLPGMACILKRP